MASYDYIVYVREVSGGISGIAPSALENKPARRWMAQTAGRYVFEKKQNVGSTIHIDRRRAGAKAPYLEYRAYRVAPDGVPRRTDGGLADSPRPLDALTPEALRELVARACDVLWPGGDPDAVWTQGTVDDVARAFADAGLRPEPARAT